MSSTRVNHTEGMRNSIGPLQRTNPLWRDLLLPFHTKSQIVLLCVLAGVAYAGARLFNRSDALVIAAIAWAGGTLQLCTVAPGRLRLPIAAEADLREILSSMHFEQSPGSLRWFYARPRWMRWENSDVALSMLGDELLVDAPLSTLTVLRYRLGHSKKYDMD